MISSDVILLRTTLIIQRHRLLWRAVPFGRVLLHFRRPKYGQWMSWRARMLHFKTVLLNLPNQVLLYSSFRSR